MSDKVRCTCMYNALLINCSLISVINDRVSQFAYNAENAKNCQQNELDTENYSKLVKAAADSYYMSKETLLRFAP